MSAHDNDHPVGLLVEGQWRQGHVAAVDTRQVTPIGGRDVGAPHASDLSPRGEHVDRCPSWCVEHADGDRGRLVHLGEVVAVSGAQSASEPRQPAALRLAAEDGQEPCLLLDSIPVGTDALLTAVRRAMRRRSLQPSRDAKCR